MKEIILCGDFSALTLLFATALPILSPAPGCAAQSKIQINAAFKIIFVHGVLDKIYFLHAERSRREEVEGRGPESVQLQACQEHSYSTQPSIS